jgi:hypothetical protein
VVVEIRFLCRAAKKNIVETPAGCIGAEDKPLKPVI